MPLRGIWILMLFLRASGQRNYIIGLDNHIFETYHAQPGTSVLIGNGLTAWDSHAVIMGQYNKVCRSKRRGQVEVLSRGGKRKKENR